MAYPRCLLHGPWQKCQWVSKMCRLFFADEYARRTVGVPTTAQVPDMEPALQAVPNILPKLEARTEWLVTFLIPAKHALDARAPHLYFMFLKEYWFRELYLGLKSALKPRLMYQCLAQLLNKMAMDSLKSHICQ